MSSTIMPQPVRQSSPSSDASGYITPTSKNVILSICSGICRILSCVLFDLKTYGGENIPRSGGVLLAANHQSYLDPIVIGVKVERPISYLANQYLFEIFGFSWLIRRLHAFPVQQGKGDRAAVAIAIDRLREGHVLNVFPEGHRSPDGQLKTLHGGVALIARKAGVPLVPVAVDGSFEAWPRHSKVFRTRPVHVMYGKPIDVSEMSSREIMETLEARIREMIEELKAKRKQSGWGN
jgi:1-acyl-sn-glycerol-3-phosphate acyltransferase